MMRRHRKKRQWDPALEPNPYRETADRISALLDEFAAALPKLEPSEMKLTAAERRAARKVSLPFIERIISMAERSQDPRIHERFDIAKLRDSLELVKAVRPILPELSTFAHSLNASIRLKMAILTGQAKETYEAALKIPPEERSPVVVKLIEDLKPVFGKRVRRRKRE
jgi:hypothetical protein